MSDIVFHLGDRKTGSTAIQYALASGAVQAPGLRIGYTAPINHIPLASSLTRPDEARFRAQRFAKALEPARAGTADVTIISAEHFEMVDPAVLRDALDVHAPDLAGRFRFVAYVRPHAERIVSTYAERVKQGHFLGTMDQLFLRMRKRGTFLYAPRFARWRAVFGPAFTLRPMIRDRLHDRDVVRDFMHVALEGAPFDLVGPPAANESLTLEDLALLRALHLRFGDEIFKGKAADVQTATAWNFARMLSAAPRPSGGTKPALHRRLAQQVQAAYAADAAALDAAFFDGTPMTDALARAGDRAVEAPQSVRIEDHFGPADRRIIDLWTWTISEMLRADPEGWPAFFRNQQRSMLRGLKRDRAAGG